MIVFTRICLLICWSSISTGERVSDGSSTTPASLDSKSKSFSDMTTAITAENLTDSSENEGEEEISCPCSNHEGREMLNDVFPMTVDQLFIWLFTDSKFFRMVHEVRNTTSKRGRWRDGAKIRQISYTVAVNHAFAPKSAEVVEKQECTDCNKSGQYYVVRCEVTNYGIPYSDTFFVITSWCLSRVSSDRCRLRMHCKIHYRKNCWGIIKSTSGDYARDAVSATEPLPLLYG
ncbi:unnamed protein product [Soboliphyme baturini]|uniref:VASt domain-containing protein n=1 Tax=Soboliphyme baturini TaxID=241478 RepID=A0A3P8AD28_9BILA|nr:unnamed protein product [Soboliphyme baturini]